MLEWNIGQIADSVQGLMMIGLEFAVFYIAIKAWQQGLFTIGDFVWIQTYLIEIFLSIWRFGRTVRDVYRNLADAEEMTEVLHTEHEIRDPKSEKQLSVVRGQIQFQDVTFGYDESSNVIDDLSFKIKSGQKVALVGPSGGGKTTITKLLLRLFDIQKGKILVDGQDIKKVTQDSLRSQISLVPQDPILFHRTLMENIRYGRRDASDKEVIAAAKLANCHDFIMSFPKKYDTFVGERGIKLSGGERQRVAIARAILANAPILILDEATSSLDSASEALIQGALENLVKDKTTLVIAHRLSTIMKMDRIIVFQGGKIVEDGSHADLVHYKTGLYKKLWDLQVGGYLDK
ncbi:ATP-binding cassette domain-containing protein [Patescibacteria group bacterium]|nr:ATP-binding cassette domain-containing protein [Patescibacteria group bacterium]